MLQVTVQAKKRVYLPIQRDADPQTVCIAAEEGVLMQFDARLARERADVWTAVSLPQEVWGKQLTITARSGWLQAVYTKDTLPAWTYEEDLRPHLFFAPADGTIAKVTGLGCRNGKWTLQYTAVPFGTSLQQTYEVSSKDLLHWSTGQIAAEDCTALVTDNEHHWSGDVEAVFGTEGVQWALSAPLKDSPLPIGNVLSIPVCADAQGVRPLAALEKLRVWQRTWYCKPITERFEFEMRFRTAPSNWPNIVILPKDGTCDDVRAQGAEVVLEMFVGKERHISFDFCGKIWHWEALTSSLRCGKYAIRVPAENGKLQLRWYYDRCVQMLFTQSGQAMLINMPQGIGNVEEERSAQVDNIDNDSFDQVQVREPYFAINCDGDTANIISLYIYGLRNARWDAESRKLTESLERGEVLFRTPDYTVFANGVEDDIYGPPCAWTPDGDTVISPVRVTEEFEWRQTPWGDMTRVMDRQEIWKTGEAKLNYPRLYCKYPVVEAAYNIATDVMYKNALPEYNLPGQKGLLNAGLFHGKGEGFGVWMRDAAQAALRTQNLLSPEVMRRTLIYITKAGFDNGDDGAAMPAVAIWDYYLLHGDKTLLYEVLPDIVRLAQKADAHYDADKKLVIANNCPAQDAFPDTEAEGYCMGTEVFYGYMYLAAANICKETAMYPEKQMLWEARGKEILAQVKTLYWNEEKGYYTTGPVGSQAFREGLWEATGMELAIWPRFDIAPPEQRERLLDEIQKRMSYFGLTWYPFRKEKNHFWGCCWVSWTLGMAVAAGQAGRLDLVEEFIFQQVRNCIMNKTFHEVIDNDTGKAWRWPGMVWHASSFVGFFINACIGLSWDGEGLHFAPAIPEKLADMQLCGLKCRDMELDIRVHGWGTQAELQLDGKAFDGHLPYSTTGKHVIDLYMCN